MARPITINQLDDVAGVQKKIDAYFKRETLYTFSGLALALGYSSRTRPYEISKENHPISEPLKIAMLRIEESYEKCLYKTQPAGAIFALKNRGWTDKPVDDEKDKIIENLTLVVEKLMRAS